MTKGTVAAVAIKDVAGGKKSYSYKINTDGIEVWVSSLKEYPISKGDYVEYTTVKKGNFVNLQSLEILPPEKNGATSGASEGPIKMVNVNYGNTKTPDSQKIISRQFLMNFTVSLLTYAANNQLTFEEAREHFLEEFSKNESFLYNNAPVSDKEVEKIVDKNLDDQLKQLVGEKKTSKK